MTASCSVFCLNVLDHTSHVEGGLKQIVIHTRQNFPEQPDSIFQRNKFAFITSENLGLENSQTNCQMYQSGSAYCQNERSRYTQHAAKIKLTATEVEVDASEALEHHDHSWNCPNELPQVLEHVSEWPEQSAKAYVPSMPQVKQTVTDGEPDASRTLWTC